MDAFRDSGLILVGCGFMGQALLQGWLTEGLDPKSVWVQDPAPSPWLLAQQGLRLNTPPNHLPPSPTALVMATKPQILPEVLPDYAAYGGGQSLIISIAAGANSAFFETILGAQTPLIRAMPNLPSSLKVGATALWANQACTAGQLDLAKDLFASVGQAVVLPDEDMLHLVTGLSGSGPAYVFALVEAMADAAADLGLPAELALALAQQTVVGAGAMLAQKDAQAADLRQAVTSKGGTTAAGLGVLFDGPQGLKTLMQRTIAAAAQRSRELSGA